MKQVTLIPTIKCESHPGATICSVQIDQKCPLRSRLACLKCIKLTKSLDNFIEINDIVSTESVITSFLSVKGFNNQIAQYLLESSQQHRQIIDNYIQELHKQIEALKANLIEQLDSQNEYLMKIAELRIQYDAELVNLQNKIQSVIQLPNYHNSKEWVELQECLESYIQLFYQPDNQEIKVTLLSLNAQTSARFNPQSIADFKDSIVIEMDQFRRQLTLNSFPQSTLDSTVFGNQIIDRITGRRMKTMKLVFNGQRDGMNGAAFWKNCLGMGPTITICESQSGQIFGGYTPCKWINDGTCQIDASLSSFLFSITKQQIYPLKVQEYAIYGNKDYGPTFGGGHDLKIAADFQSGCSDLGHTYDVSQYQIANQYTHLFEGRTPALKNIEVYLIE